MKKGEKRQVSLWYSGLEQLAKAQLLIEQAFRFEEEELNVKYDYVKYYAIDLPNPPEEGARVLVGESTLIDDGFEKFDTYAFTKTLSNSDLERLRQITQKQWLKVHPDAKPLPVQTLDAIIAEEGYKRIVSLHQGSMH